MIEIADYILFLVLDMTHFVFRVWSATEYSLAESPPGPSKVDVEMQLPEDNPELMDGIMGFWYSSN